MQFKKFGQTGLTVSRLCLGTGTFGKQTDEAEAHRMFDKVAESGVNFIDTANIYPPGAEVGTSEAIGEVQGFTTAGKYRRCRSSIAAFHYAKKA
jgi:aryl-alcohol dehydrogenase-like predicted oxidoreductase